MHDLGLMHRKVLICYSLMNLFIIPWEIRFYYKSRQAFTLGCFWLLHYAIWALIGSVRVGSVHAELCPDPNST